MEDYLLEFLKCDSKSNLLQIFKKLNTDEIEKLKKYLKNDLLQDLYNRRIKEVRRIIILRKFFYDCLDNFELILTKKFKKNVIKNLSRGFYEILKK